MESVEEMVLLLNTCGVIGLTRVALVGRETEESLAEIVGLA